MKTYKYTAISNSGVNIEGIIKASNEVDAVVKLKDTCSTVIDLKQVEEIPSFIEKLNKGTIVEKRLALVCQQFSIILNAGLPIIRCIDLVARQTDDKTLRELLQHVSDDVKSGSSLATAFANGNSSLPSTFVESIRAGEATGNLGLIFERLSVYFNKRSSAKSKIISSLIYPVFIIVVAVVVVIILMAFAVPSFTRTFNSMGIELPLPTRILIATSNFTVKFGPILLIILLLGILSLRVYYHTDNGRKKIDEFKLMIPLFGRMQLMNAASQFANTFSTVLSSGLPVVNGMEVTAKSLTNNYIASTIETATVDVESGYRIGESLQKCTPLPELLIALTSIGEESGSIEAILRIIADYYDNEVTVATARFTSVLEPVVICILAVIVVFILLSVYLPMFSLYGSI